MSVLDLLKPAPIKEEIQDEEIVKKKYKYWRFRTFYAMYVGYAFYYFTRKSFTFAIPALKEHFHYDLYQLGLVSSVLSITYGISKFVSGIIGDRSNPRYFMSVGLILTGIFNLLFGFSSTLLFFTILWGLNGWFQGWGWPGCAKLLTHWYSHSERGRWWSIWNTSHNIGGALIPYIVAHIVFYLGWRYALILPGTLCIIVGIFLINRLRDTPQSLGLPGIEKFRGDFPNAISQEKEKLQLSVKEILFKYVLCNPMIWILALSYFFIYIIRTAINDWTLLYFVEQRGYSYKVAGFCVCWFEVGGFFGSLTAGWASDKIFEGKRNPVNAIFSAAVILSILGLWFAEGPNPVRDGLSIFLIGFFIFGPQMLIGMAAAELSHKKAAATATGFAGCFAYLGAAAAGAPLGMMTKTWGWEGFFMVLCICGVISTLLLFPMWSMKTNPKEA